MLFVTCLTSQQHASVSQRWICSENLTCCHTEIEVTDPNFHLTQSQYTDTGPTSPSTDPITPGAWQGSHWNANFQVTGMTRPRKILAQVGFEPGIFRFRDGHLNHYANKVVADMGIIPCFFLSTYNSDLTRRATAQKIHICHTYMTSLQSSSLHHQPRVLSFP